MGLGSNYGPSGDSASCTIILNGGLQECNTGLLPVGSTLIFSLDASLQASLASVGDSATIDYWGTFTPGPLQIYDAGMNLIGTVDLPGSPSDAPEPTSLVLVGSGMIGFVTILRRRIRQRKKA